MSAELQPTLFDMSADRTALDNQLAVLNEQKWDLLDQLCDIELGRTAVLLAIRETAQ